MDPQEFDHELSDLEVNLERLRALYEQYFLGIERIEPAVARKAVDRRFWQLKRIKVRNTARRFRLQMLVQRYNTLQQHWTKVCRQIENGTYVRHVQRARRRLGSHAAPVETPTLARTSTRADTAESEPVTGAAEDESSHSTAESVATALVPPPTSPDSPVQFHAQSGAKRISLAPLSPEAREKIRSSAPPAPIRRKPGRNMERQRGDTMTGSRMAGHQDGISEERVGGLYNELQRVRRRLNQDEMGVSIDALSRSLRATEARLKAKYAGKRVDFRVEIHDGKAVIKPTVKR